MVTKEQVIALKEEYQDILLAIPGVTGVGVGGYDRLKIYVEDKNTKELLENLLSKEVIGVPVEIIVTGRARLFSS